MSQAKKFAAIAAASSGDNTVIAAPAAGLKIRVWGLVIVADGTVDARFEDGAAGTALTGQCALSVSSGYTMPIGEFPWWELTAATLLNLELSGAVGVNGTIVYDIV